MKLGEITLIQVENLGKIKFASLQLNGKGELVKIAGPNESGKSTLIDSLKMAFESAKSIPDDIIMHGQDTAHVKIETSGGYDIHRTIRKGADGAQVSVLEVKYNGAPVKGGAVTFLKQLSAAYMDPQALTAYTDVMMLRILAKYAGFDFEASEKIISDKKDNITSIKRSITNLGNKTPPAGSVAGSIFDLQEATNAYTAASEAYNHAVQLQTKSASRMKELSNLLATTDTEIKEVEEKLIILRDRRQKTVAATEEGRKWMEANPAPTMANVEAAKSIMDQAIAQQTNTEEAKRYELWYEQKVKFEEDAKATEAEVKVLEDARKKSLETASFPDSNLRIQDGKVFLGEGLWINGSTSAKLVAAAKICTASIPADGARILYIHRGESIGADRQKMLAEFAKENNVQILMEIMSDTPETIPESIIIQDGEVVVKCERDPESTVTGSLFDEPVKVIAPAKKEPAAKVVDTVPWGIEPEEEPASPWENELF